MSSPLIQTSLGESSAIMELITNTQHQRDRMQQSRFQQNIINNSNDHDNNQIKNQTRM